MNSMIWHNYGSCMTNSSLEIVTWQRTWLSCTSDMIANPLKAYYVSLRGKNMKSFSVLMEDLNPNPYLAYDQQ